MEVAISCVIPACLNTNIQTPQLQNKPGKRGAEEALHCALPAAESRVAAQMANAPGTHAAGSGRRAPTGSQCPPQLLQRHTKCSSSPNRVSSLLAKINQLLYKEQKGLVVGALLKVFPHLALDSVLSVPRVGTRWSKPFCCVAPVISPTLPLHAVPLASWAATKPFLSWEPAVGVRGMLSSLGEVYTPPSQARLRHSPFLNGAFWLLLWSTLPSFPARFTPPRQL